LRKKGVEKVKEKIGSIRLAEDSGSERILGEILQEADYTVLVFYRGDW